LLIINVLTQKPKGQLYPSWSRLGTYRRCCSSRDGARTSG